MNNIQPLQAVRLIELGNWQDQATQAYLIDSDAAFEQVKPLLESGDASLFFAEKKDGASDYTFAPSSELFDLKADAIKKKVTDAYRSELDESSYCEHMSGLDDEFLEPGYYNFDEEEFILADSDLLWSYHYDTTETVIVCVMR